MRRLLVLAILLLLACARDTISRDEWRRMPREDRVLYVQTLVAEEVAKDAKGDRGKVRQRPAEEYVNDIDQAYARGDRRNADEIFEGLH
jgi:hypothetical protein